MPNSKKSIGPVKAVAANTYEQLAGFIDALSESFIVIDHSGKITQCNNATLALLQAPKLSGKQLADELVVIDRAGHTVDLQKKILLSDRGFSSREWRLRYPDGQAINIEVSSSPASPEGYVLLLRNISGDTALEAEREMLTNMATQELRAPVALAENSLNNALQIAERTDAIDPIKHSIVAAYQQLTFLATLINNLALLGRAEGAKSIQVSETFAAKDLLEELAGEYQPQAAKKRLSLKVEVKSSVGLVTSSRIYVREILQNFISNATKYTEKGSITLKALPMDGGLIFSVVDTGIGVGDNEQNQLFTKFYRSDDWRVRENAGAGLGLYVSAKLAALIGAKIELESKLGKGSAFKLYVPNLEIAS